MANVRDLIDVDLEGQLADLRKDLASLKRAVGRRGSSLYEDAGETISEYLSDLSSRVGPSLHGLRSRARSVERVAYDHPAVVAGVALAVIGLVASLLISRRSSAPPARAERPSRGTSGGGNRRRGRAAAG